MRSEDLERRCCFGAAARDHREHLTAMGQRGIERGAVWPLLIVGVAFSPAELFGEIGQNAAE